MQGSDFGTACSGKSAECREHGDKTGHWDQLNELKIVPGTHATTDDKGHFTTNVGASGPVEIYGKFLVVAYLRTPASAYYSWMQEIEVKKGEKTPPVILSEPAVCRDVSLLGAGPRP